MLRAVRIDLVVHMQDIRIIVVFRHEANEMDGIC